jgi:hypothetical protein
MCFLCLLPILLQLLYMIGWGYLFCNYFMLGISELGINCQYKNSMCTKQLTNILKLCILNLEISHSHYTLRAWVVHLTINGDNLRDRSLFMEGGRGIFS